MKLTVLLKLILGFLALLLAAVGLFLPIWPTTPFILLAIGCFSATPKLRDKLLRIHWIREYYEGYTTGKGIRRKTAAVSIGFLWVMLMISMLLLSRPWIILLLLMVGAAVTVHILWLSKDRERSL